MADSNSPIFKTFELIILITGKIVILALIGVKLRDSPSTAPMPSSPPGLPGAT